jgi:dipeptidase
MGCDMVVALGQATVDGQTLFGQNSDRPGYEGRLLGRYTGGEHVPGEVVRTQYLQLPQIRRTYTVIASQPDQWWGYSHGVNDQGVAIGGTVLRNRLPCQEPGLTGGDLVRLMLERSRTAGQAVSLLIDLVERCGQTSAPGCSSRAGSDHGFIIADGTEAFAVETAGHHWVYQEIQQVRTASNVCLIRQDWDRISHGLAPQAIEQGWWPGDGSKIDFAGTLSECPVGQASGLRRWGRSTFLLEQQNGHIDTGFFRRVLSDHYEGTNFEVDPLAESLGPVPICQHGNGPGGSVTVTSMVNQLSADAAHLQISWCAFGPPCGSVYFPIFLEGELPPALAATEANSNFEFRNSNFAGYWSRLCWLGECLRKDPGNWDQARDSFGRLQASFDLEAEEFAVEGAVLKQKGEIVELQRRATLFMQQCVERFEVMLEKLESDHRRPGPKFMTVLVSDF